LPACQQARKRNWQRDKFQNDPEYRESQRLSQQKWLQANPGYYRHYRRNNPAKTRRNRVLQRIRNRRRRHPSPAPPQLIAKMDVRKRSADEFFGHYWLVPEIAKMDAAKIYIHAISASCEQLQRWTRGQRCL